MPYPFSCSPVICEWLSKKIQIEKKEELLQIASNHSSNIEFKIFMKLNEGYTKEPFSFLVNDRTLLSDNPLRFWKNLL